MSSDENLPATTKTPLEELQGMMGTIPCPHCLQSFPLHQMQVRVINGYRTLYLCKDCDAAAQKKLVAAHRAMEKQVKEEQASLKEAHAELTKLVKMLDGSGPKGQKSADTTDLADRLLEYFPAGLDGMAAQFVLQLTAAMTASPGSKTVLDGFSRLFNVIDRATIARQQSMKDAAQLSDEDLKREAERLLAEQAKKMNHVESLVIEAESKLIEEEPHEPGD